MHVQYILPELFQKNVIWTLGIDCCLIKVSKNGGLGSPGDCSKTMHFFPLQSKTADLKTIRNLNPLY